MIDTTVYAKWHQLGWLRSSERDFGAGGLHEERGERCDEARKVAGQCLRPNEVQRAVQEALDEHVAWSFTILGCSIQLQRHQILTLSIGRLSWCQLPLYCASSTIKIGLNENTQLCKLPHPVPNPSFHHDGCNRSTLGCSLVRENLLLVVQKLL